MEEKGKKELTKYLFALLMLNIIDGNLTNYMYRNDLITEFNPITRLIIVDVHLFFLVKIFLISLILLYIIYRINIINNEINKLINTFVKTLVYIYLIVVIYSIGGLLYIKHFL